MRFYLGVESAIGHGWLVAGLVDDSVVLVYHLAALLECLVRLMMYNWRLEGLTLMGLDLRVRWNEGERGRSVLAHHDIVGTTPESLVYCQKSFRHL